MNRVVLRATGLVALALAVASCGKGATDSTPPVPLTTVVGIDLVADADSLLVGDSLVVTARGVNREGTVLPLANIVWTTTDSGVGAITPNGVVRGRNIGTIRIDAQALGAAGGRPIRIVPRPLRVRLLAPDTVQLVDVVEVSTEIETTAGLRLTEIAPRLAVTDTTVAQLVPVGLGRATLQLVGPGRTELLAVIGRDTTRRRFVVRLSPLQSLSLNIPARVLAVGDSVPYFVTAIDSLGRVVPPAGTIFTVEPSGPVFLRNGHMIAVALGRVIVRATNGTQSSRDTITAQGPSEFPLDIVDGDGQNPLPLRVLLSMERVAIKWRQVLRSTQGGDFVRLQIGQCRNAVTVAQFISGVRVLIKLDSLPNRIAGQGGPCVLRSNGLPLLGTVSLNRFRWSALSDRKLDDLIQHEVGHVLGIGTIWGRGSFTALVDGDSTAVDPIFVGPSAVGAFAKLGGSSRFAGRPVPLEVAVRGHWRGDAFGAEVMAPSLISADQVTSAVTVAALRDLGWVVESEAYDEYTLPDAVLRASSSARVAIAVESLERDMLLPKLMITPDGRMVALDVMGRPVRR